MLALPEVVALPLKMDRHGAIRVSGTRVTFESLISFYRQGETPKALHEGFPTVPLADIFAVLAYYLSHQADMDDYLKQRAAAADRMRQEWEPR